jgi:hypothetical protein
MVFRLRDTVERSLGALLVARRAHHNPKGCPELGAILADWDGRFSVLMRKRIARHIESCSTCEQVRREVVNPRALLGAVPVFIPAPWRLRGHTLSQIQLTAAETTLGPSGNTDTNGRSSLTTPDTRYPRTSPFLAVISPTSTPESVCEVAVIMSEMRWAAGE